MKNLIILIICFTVQFSSLGQVSPSSGRIQDINTNFSFRITDKQYDRILLQSGWVSGIGDYLSLKHGGGNTEEYTYGLRLSDGYGLDFGRNNFGISFFKIKTNGFVGIGVDDPKDKLEVFGNALINNRNNRGDAILKLDRGAQGRDAALVSYGQDDNFLWNTGLLYSGGSPTTSFYISQKRAIRDGNGSFIHTPELTIRQNGYLGIGTITPQERLEVVGNALINNQNNRGDAILRLDRGSEGKDAALVSFGQNNTYLWNAGLLYGGGGLMPSFYISQKRATRDGNGNWVHTPELTINQNGNIGVGTTKPDSKLTVKGNIHAEEVKIDLSVPAPDYVFKKEYDLLTIEEVQQHINQKGHLPNIPSAKTMETEGVNLGTMNMKLLEKIEELTLYTIHQEIEINKLKEKNKEVKALKDIILRLQTRLENLELNKN